MADGGAAGVERFVWEVLVPRLLHPSQLAVIRALLEHGRPLSLSELAEAAEVTTEYATYICGSMASAGVLEVSMAPSEGGDGGEPSYFFPKPPQAPA
jgi:DNA-binding MarR family transcriptional regulator